MLSVIIHVTSLTWCTENNDTMYLSHSLALWNYSNENHVHSRELVLH